MNQQINEINQIFDRVIQELPKLKDELNNNKDNVKKLYEIADKIENLQAEIILHLSLFEFLQALLFQYKAKL